MSKNYVRVLTIAGSDSGGGAGIQADLKTFSALGCYGMSVITALTAQNTVAVTAIHEVPAEFVGAQISAILDDIGVDAVKIGMLQTPDVIRMVARSLRRYDIRRIVLDPVMVAKSGDKLLKDEAVEALKTELIPLAEIITPNIPEARVLSGEQINGIGDMEKTATGLLALGSKSVLLKGGHLPGDNGADCLVFRNNDRTNTLFIEFDRINTVNTHGTGCTLSSAIAAFRAHNYSISDSVEKAHSFIYQAILNGSNYILGKGHGPVMHFYDFWR
jgi:hydroxymethylpyrimidine/phosphomethylpyrimidine kinase